MALETVNIVLDQTWQLISNAGAGRFNATVIEGVDALFSIGAVAPAADSLIGRPAKALSFDALDGKVWARGAGIPATLSILRVVDAGNPAIPMLGTLTLSGTTFGVGAAEGTDIGTFGGLGSGDTVESITPNDGRVVLNGARSKLLVGMTASSAGTIRVRVKYRNPKAPNSPKEETFTLTVSSGSTATVPAAMAAPTLTAGDGQITVARAAAPNDGGSPITSYDARRSTDGATWTTTTGLSASQAITGLTNGTAYQIQTRAVNGVGAGAWSPSATATPVAAAALQRLALNAPLVMNGNSKNAQRFANDYAQFAVNRAGGRFYTSPWWRQSKGGDWVKDFVQRMPACIALGSYAGQDGVLWLGDATNSVGKSGETPAVIEAQYRDAATQWFAARPNGRCLIELTARISGWAAGGSTDLDRQALNTRIVNMCAEAAWGGRLDTIDLTPLSANLQDTAQSSDGTHYTTAKLADAAAQIVAAKLAALITTDPLVPADGTVIATQTGFGPNVNPEWKLPDDDGNGVPNNYVTANLSGATLAFSMATRAARRALRFMLSGAAVAVATDRVYRVVPGLAIPAGEVYETIYPYEITNAAGTGDATIGASPSGVSGGGTAFGTVISAATGPFPMHTGVMRVPSAPVVPGSGQTQVSTLSSELGFRHPVGMVDTVGFLFEGHFVRKAEATAYSAPFSQAISYTQPSDGEIYALFTGPAASKSGNVANVTPGNVSGGGITITYQWRKDGAAISGATSRFYDTAAVAGTFDCDVTYTNSLGTLTLRSTSVTNP